MAGRLARKGIFSALDLTPDDPCAATGAGNGNGEFLDFQQCVLDEQANGGVADDDTRVKCAGESSTPACGIISDATNAMIACSWDKCFDVCFASSN